MPRRFRASIMLAVTLAILPAVTACGRHPAAGVPVTGSVRPAPVPSPVPFYGPLPTCQARR